LHNPSQTTGDNLINVRHETNRNFGNEEEGIPKIKNYWAWSKS